MAKIDDSVKKKVPELRFKGFTDDWEQRKLGEVGNTFTGLSGKTKEDFGHGEGKFITDEWEQRKLGDEVRIVMGQSPNSENYTDDPNGR